MSRARILVPPNLGSVFSSASVSYKSVCIMDIIRPITRNLPPRQRHKLQRYGKRFALTVGGLYVVYLALSYVSNTEIQTEDTKVVYGATGLGKVVISSQSSDRLRAQVHALGGDDRSRDTIEHAPNGKQRNDVIDDSGSRHTGEIGQVHTGGDRREKLEQYGWNKHPVAAQFLNGLVAKKLYF